jgi:TAG lipase / steryl ester hydrolase / phospholipase A2 / LPA acyltransferase
MAVGKRALNKALSEADTYEEWRGIAAEIDRRNGACKWQTVDRSSQYDYVSIRHKLDQLRSLRARHDNRGLLYTIGEGIHGNLGGMGSSGLYDLALTGTKSLIVDYVEEVADALELLAAPTTTDLSFEEKLEFFRRAHHCFGRSALMMSGSGTLLYFHAGVVRALAAQNLLPNILSGASGGSVVGALVCSKTNDELQDLLRPDHLYSKIVDAVGGKPSRGLSRLRLLRFDEISSMIEQLVPDYTFQQAYELTGRMLNVSIAPAETHQTSRLLNATTSPHVLIQKALMASVAVPGLYQPVTLAARDHLGDTQEYLPTRKWVDGSVSEDLPTKRLARLYGVNHYIVSQTNPAVLPFVTDAKRQRGAAAIVKGAARRTAREWMNAGAALFDRPLSGNSLMAQAANLLMSVVNQDYIGDVNIMPRNRIPHPFRVLHHLGEKEIAQLMREGERATWRRMEMIRVQTRISRILEEILQRYEAEHTARHSSQEKRAA